MTERAAVLHPFLKRQGKNLLRTPALALAEAVRLTEAIHLEVTTAEAVPLADIHPAAYVSKGVIDRLKTAGELDLLIMDCRLSPVQQRNLETALDVKVLDRTALILEIFGERARTKEGVLQVELAHLTYQRSRLVRGWTHLERQRGGGGFIGGPGEKQIELDRRQIDDRIIKLKKELDDVIRTRTLQRRARQDVPYPVVALVGYTNAGKSTLFNRLTDAGVFAKDQLFATLDPTLRKIRLPSGRAAILSDTVGFISDLPHELIAAFRATLEEVLEADMILHVRDMASEESAAQKKDVEAILADLHVPPEKVYEVFNKIDLLPSESVRPLLSKSAACAFSARTGEGLGDLLSLIDRHLSSSLEKRHISLPIEDGGRLAWLYRHGEVVSRRESEDKIFLSVLLSPENIQKWEAMKQE